MAFQIKPLKEFLVRPALPQSLARMSELAYNLLWSWDHNLRRLFRRLDPALWQLCGNNPVLMLGRVPQVDSGTRGKRSAVSRALPPRLRTLRQLHGIRRDAEHRIG